MRAIFDAQEIGLILIGMPGLEQRLARYPQFYSRTSFVYEFSPLGAPEVRRLLEQHWAPVGVKLAQTPLDPEPVAVIIRVRVSGGYFRLLNRLLTQIQRILEINALEEGDQSGGGTGARGPRNWTVLGFDLRYGGRRDFPPMTATSAAALLIRTATISTWPDDH